MTPRTLRTQTPMAIVCAMLASAASAAPAYAQSATAATNDAHEQERTALYRDGVTLAEAGQWGEALKKFQSVVAMRSAPAALLALGTAEENLGSLASARRDYAKARDEARTVGDRTALEKASSKFAALQSRVPRLVIRLSDRSKGAVVTIDGERTSLPEDGSVELDPGEHAVVVTSEGLRPYEQRAVLAEGDKKEWLVDLAAGHADSAGHVEGATSASATNAPNMSSNARDATPSSETNTASTAQAESSRLPLGPLVLGGAGLAATILGGVVYSNAHSTYAAGDAVRGCGSAVCNQAKQNANDARTSILVGSAVAWTGVAAVAGAGVWWLLSPREHGSESHGSARALDVSAVPLPGGCWVSVDRAF
jgi:hypothetical protein